MRSVVVVLPASMCAMMPMLRTFVRSVSTSCATGVFPYLWVREGGRPFVSLRSLRDRFRRMRSLSEAESAETSGLPAVVREGAVRLGHLVGVLAALDRGAQAVRRIQDLVLEAFGHRLLTTTLCVA